MERGFPVISKGSSDQEREGDENRTSTSLSWLAERLRSPPGLESIDGEASWDAMCVTNKFNSE